MSKDYYTNINTHLNIHLIYYTNIFPTDHPELDLIRPSAMNLMQLIPYNYIILVSI